MILHHVIKSASLRPTNFTFLTNNRVIILRTLSSQSSNIKQQPNKSNKTPASKSSKPGLLASSLNLPKDKLSPHIAKYGSDESAWTEVYRFPYIRQAHVIQRLKIYQTAFTCGVVLPVTILSSFSGHIAPETLGIVGAACVLACGVLYVMGNFASRLIGIIYVTDQAPNIVRVAHMTFWGSRKDDIFKKDDFVPLSDLADDLNDTYLNLKFYSDPELKLHLTLKHGTIIDEEKFREIFSPTFQIKEKIK